MKTEELQNQTFKPETSLVEIILTETFVLIGENFDLSNTYKERKIGRTIWSFTDQHKVEHTIKLNFNVSSLNVKFFWEDENSKPNYNRPPFTDEKVFNTHLYVLVTHILPYVYSEIFNNPRMDTVHKEMIRDVRHITLDATDSLRHRLYRIALSSGILDNANYTLKDPKRNNELFMIPNKITTDEN